MKEEEQNKGLYDASFEHDACGIGFLAHLKGERSHSIVEDALQMLLNMDHRGACGCDENSGDGAGILIQIPHEFYQKETEKLGFTLPGKDEYGVGLIFFPSNEEARNACRTIFEEKVDELGLELLGYRRVPVDNSMLGEFSGPSEPVMEHAFIKKPDHMEDPEDFERKLFVLRNYVTQLVYNDRPVENLDGQFHIASLSYKTIAYKGQLTTGQVTQYFPDLHDKDVKTSLALIHSRFSTNTFPEWRLAQPFRYIAHNGEINTNKGNLNWMRSKEALFKSDKFSDEDLKKIFPVCDHTQSDSANLDNAIEMLSLSGRSLPHVMMMLIPEAWQSNEAMDPAKRAFYEYHASMMEPWDGPASICFTDGKFVGATLDRNGLRPSRYMVTKDDRVIMASETGVLPVKPDNIASKGRLKPGRMFIADLEQGRIISDEELKQEMSARQPYEQWLKDNKYHIDDIPETIESEADIQLDEETLLNRQHAFGYSSEDLKVLLAPMARDHKEPIGSMGADTPISVLSEQSQHLSHYFKQLFAQVTNPPIDPIRERLVMSLMSFLGGYGNILSEEAEHCRVIQLDQPVVTNTQLDKLKKIDDPNFKTVELSTVFATDKLERLEEALDKISEEATKAVQNGANILVLSDRAVDNKHAPIPSLLAVGAVHHHLIREGLRGKTAIIAEAGDVRETHHFATLVGYGASGVNPYLAFESILNLKRINILDQEFSDKELINNYIEAVNSGLLKVLSKMGISTLQSYQGAQIFEAVGLKREVIDKYFAGTASKIEGIGLDGIAKEAVNKHKLAFPDDPNEEHELEVGGIYQWKRRGEFHLFNPQTIHLLQHSTRTNNYQLYKKYSRLINQQAKNYLTLRGLLNFKEQNPIPLNQVEPVEKIFKRFATGAMSFGSISYESHRDLAIAMNRIGGKSNSGEGGEDEARFFPNENGDWERSAIKQCASGRFGVTSNYLTNADELQIKMAQGAKPGEGGQLPGHKVDEWIARVRNSTPGVGLISPPPHHDIYSIEDLAQLIHDLKNSNRDARVNVKLVSCTGVGTVAAGVSKGHADVVLISGHDGGTGASPLSSIRHAGLPWELGLAETHQTLVQNKLRSRITVQTDGQIRTGRDLAIAAMLGAEEWGVATAALVVEGCIMMRKCHLNTCPVGVATQDTTLRDRYPGNPDHIVNFFHFLAYELREIMANLGFRTVDEMVGRADCLETGDLSRHWKYKDLDLSPILYKQPAESGVGVYKQEEQDHNLEEALDWDLLEAAKPALEKQQKVVKEFEINNVNRTVGTILSNEISKKYGSPGLPEDTIHFKFTGSAGQSFGAFSAPGLKMELEGEANDYFGKGLSGSKLILYPHRDATFEPSENIIVGNVAFYGGTGGQAYINGMGGERFCVRNSGVRAVVEGVGDHGCEYMTGGVAVILGETGVNFAAGMSGGVAYVYDPDKVFPARCNQGMVDLDSKDEEDFTLMKELIRNHYKYTGSKRAKAILDNWEEESHLFVKVMPRDYKEVLQKNKEKQEQQSKEGKKEGVLHG